jgi:hypothetical protein
MNRRENRVDRIVRTPPETNRAGPAGVTMARRAAVSELLSIAQFTDDLRTLAVIVARVDNLLTHQAVKDLGPGMFADDSIEDVLVEVKLKLRQWQKLAKAHGSGNSQGRRFSSRPSQ